uniref:PARP-type domain-containing protein n=1 Tax=Zooxanthella nutricula TaxID=1333877 RepID=A0A7S2QBZ8_9DINO
MCKNQECLERFSQGGTKFIEKGDLRIGRRVLMQGRHGSDEGMIQIMWYHARCIFDTFMRARKSTRVIQTPEDLEGFAHIDAEDQDMLRRFIASNDEARTWHGRGRGGAAAGAKNQTPEKPGGTKRGAEQTPDKSRGVGLLGEPAGKRRKQEDVLLKKGDRVWTFCRVRPPVVDGRPPAEAAVKSAKPELGMIVDEVKDGAVIVQFEKAEDEKDRVAMFQNPKKAKIRSWLKYPRCFEGKKQRIPLSWIVKNRPPPRLCGCTIQQWGHSCKRFSDGGVDLGSCGVSCSRGTSRKVWGVGQ